MVVYSFHIMLASLFGMTLSILVARLRPGQLRGWLRVLSSAVCFFILVLLWTRLVAGDWFSWFSACCNVLSILALVWAALAGYDDPKQQRGG